MARTKNETVPNANEVFFGQNVKLQCPKAAVTLADFDDKQIFDELSKRGYSGRLRYSKVVRV